MKIKRNILNENILQEAPQEEITVDEINPSEASVDTIANALQNSVEEISGGEDIIKDETAKSAAKEIKDAADDIEAGNLALDDSFADDEKEHLHVENELTRKLDKALYTAQQGRRQKSNKNANVLVTGLPGSGKTSIVFDWAEGKVNVFSVSAADPDLEDAIYGLTLRDTTVTDKNVTTKATTTFLDSLDQENSVLFLDEFNRAKSSLRRALLSLVNEHTVPDPSYPKGVRVFKNLLFTVACINPGGLRTDKNAELLSDAEKSRFGLKLNFDSNAETAVDYFTKHWDNLIAKLDPNDKYYKADLEEYLRAQDLGLYLVSHPDFHFDGKDVLDELSDEAKTMLNQRSLTDGLNISAGDVDEFKDWLENNSEYLQDDIDMITTILDSYKVPTFQELLDKKNLSAVKSDKPDAVDGSNGGQVTSNTENDDEEDDENFFQQQATGKVAVNPGDAEAQIRAAMALFQ